MPQLQSNGGCKCYFLIKSPVHVFSKIIKPNGVDFHGNKLLAEETTTRTYYSNNAFIKSSNLLERLPNILLQEPANPARSNVDKPPVQNVEILCSDAIISNKKR